MPHLRVCEVKHPKDLDSLVVQTVGEVPWHGKTSS